MADMTIKKKPIDKVLEQLSAMDNSPMVPSIKKLKKIVKQQEVKKHKKIDELAKVEESVEIINNNYAQVYDEVNDSRACRKKHQIRENIKEWSNLDFAMYIEQSYYKKYYKDWGLNKIGFLQSIARIIDTFNDRLGYFSNIAFKEYIDYFFEKFIDKIVCEGDCFDYAKMYNKEAMYGFKSTYNYTKELAKEEKESFISEVFSEIDLIDSFHLGEAHLLCNYGIVIAYWFMKKQGLEKEDIISSLVKVCKELDKNNKFDIIENSTNKYTYPHYLNSEDFQNFLSIVDKKFSIHFVSGKKEMFNFLKEKNV